MSTADLAIRTQGLRKVFRRQHAVDGIDLAVPRGSVFGFLGPNGSGKTTTIRMLLGLTAASAGTIEVLGERMPRALPSVLPRVGALVEGPASYPFLSGRANLHRFDAADPRSDPTSRTRRVDAALDRVGLTHAADKKAGAYSLGMKQRLGLANALLTQRDLLVLDEPTNGLDPQGTREVRNLIRSLADDGTTVFVSSHLLAEIEQVCTHAGVMRAGSLVAQGSLDELRRVGTARVTVQTPDRGDAHIVLTRLGLHVDATSRSDGLVADLPDEVPAETVTAALVEAGVRVRGIAVGGGTLEDRFVALTGEGFDVAG
ncbi:MULTISPECIES: ABC transporter ATP-binding protein [unclassified Curtobacterium]|uniref:ABC transporter ATP-binding protein n=1 Tax=unclassified Curtobacterium TaxID=257496 RepID=UPI000DA7E077|nr:MULTISPECIES: ATP-binding cassette domain-containing protein [unclassified Curtobacterium]PZE25661.1 ABC transporter ATP-binding protein [Curtobacterium sp. MCBD17_028]WIE55319.1 ATP-binding cassette domain-containing protein [Curtobacterium sp. MCBD17_003]